MVEQQLASLGFSANEVAVYLSLAESGRGIAAQVSRRTGIRRTTVYSVLASLTLRGLVSEERSRDVTYFVANEPDALLQQFEKERRELERKEAVTRELAQSVQPYFRGAAFKEPRLQFFDGSANVETLLFQNTERWRESLRQHDHIWWGYQDPSFVDQYRSWLDHAWATADDGEKIQLLSHASAAEESLIGRVPGRTIRFLPDNIGFSSTIWVLGDFIVMIMTHRQPHYAFQIREAELAKNLRTLFTMLWREGPRAAPSRRRRAPKS